MRKNQQKWTVKKATATVRILLLLLVSIGITIAVFVVDENKPVWVLIAAPAVTVFFALLLYRTMKTDDYTLKHERLEKAEVSKATDGLESVRTGKTTEMHSSANQGPFMPA